MHLAKQVLSIAQQPVQKYGQGGEGDIIENHFRDNVWTYRFVYYMEVKTIDIDYYWSYWHIMGENNINYQITYDLIRHYISGGPWTYWRSIGPPIFKMKRCFFFLFTNSWCMKKLLINVMTHTKSARLRFWQCSDLFKYHSWLPNWMLRIFC